MFNLLLGHLIGDYLLQTNWMALNKHRYDFKGWSACFVHCLLYATAIMICMWPFVDPVTMWMIAFATHFPLDKFGLADKYLKAIGGRSPSVWLAEMNSFDSKYNHTPETLLMAGFTAYVYAVCDNTMHILLMWICLMVLL